MKKVRLCLLIVVVILIGFSCSKKEEVKQERKRRVKPVPPIVRLDVVPEVPVSGKDIEVFPLMADEAKGNKVTLMVQWILNGDTLEDETDLMLARDKYVKGDKVQCVVMASLSGRHLQTIKTKKLVISNTPPEIHPKTPDSFELPGTFYYKIKASDSDGDELTYTLVSPLNRGIRLDETTGEIKWYLSRELLEKMADEARVRIESGAGNEEKTRVNMRNVQVEFEVVDTDNSSAQGSILLNLISGRESDPI